MRIAMALLALLLSSSAAEASPQAEPPYTLSVFATVTSEIEGAVLSMETDPSDTLLVGAGSFQGIWTVSASGQFDLLVPKSATSGPASLAFDAAGDLFIADVNLNRISRFDTGGSVSTFVDLPAQPNGIAFTPGGDLLVLSSSAGTVYSVSPSAQLSVLATGLDFPKTLAMDGPDALVVVRDANGTLLRIAPDGSTSPVVADLEAATPNQSGFVESNFDSLGNLYLAAANDVIVVAPDLTVSSVVRGVGASRIAVNAADELFVDVGFEDRIYRLTRPFDCVDGLDNDGDGRVDAGDDPGCEDPNDLDETSPDLVCDDGQDNDGDGLTDVAEDPGCDDPEDDSERGPGLVCDDGLDNDGDLVPDFPADLGCDGPEDDSEQSAAFACDDGSDNDGDGTADFPADPGCALSVSPSEAPACQDGLDNDGDLGVDFDGGVSAGAPPADPDPNCLQPWQQEEVGGRPRCGAGAALLAWLPVLMVLRVRRRSRLP